MKLPVEMVENILFVLGRTARTSQIYVDREMGELGLTQSQWLLLSQLYFVNGCTQRELAELIGIGKGSLGELVKKLEDKGWVTRKSDAIDGRARNIFITDNAYPIVKKLMEMLFDYTEQCVSGVSEDELLTVRTIVNKIRLNIKNIPSSSKWKQAKLELANLLDE